MTADEVKSVKELAMRVSEDSAKLLELIYLFTTPWGLKSGICRRGHDVTAPGVIYKNPNTRDQYCTLCRTINHKTYYKKNREKILRNNKIRYDAQKGNK